MTVNVYHKHSVVKGKAPDPKQLELGEIAINANQDSPAIYIKDSADNIVEIGAGCDCDAINEKIKELEFNIQVLEDKLALIPDPDKVESLFKLLAALEAQLLLLAQHNVDQDKQLADIQTELGKIEVNINEIAKDVEDLDTRVKALIVRVDKHDDRLDVLETVKVTAGNGIIVKRQGDYEFKVSVDKDWLDDYVQKIIDNQIEPYYAKIDISDNLDELT